MGQCLGVTLEKCKQRCRTTTGQNKSAEIRNRRITIFELRKLLGQLLAKDVQQVGGGAADPDFGKIFADLFDTSKLFWIEPLELISQRDVHHAELMGRKSVESHASDRAGKRIITRRRLVNDISVNQSKRFV